MPPQAHLKPDKLETDPTDADAEKKFKHWLKCFQNYAAGLPDEEAPKTAKLNLLINFISPLAFSIIENIADYDTAITTLTNSYKKEVNLLYARHILATRKQRSDESMDDYLRNLKLLAKDCEFAAVTAAEHHNESVRDAFISGLRAPYIRQRLLENATLTLDAAFTTARSLEVAQKNAETYTTPNLTCSAIEQDTPSNRSRPPENPETSENLVAASRFNNYRRPYKPQNSTYDRNEKCYFCGYDKHASGRRECPAKDTVCSKCHIKGHYARVCRSNPAPSSRVMAATYPNYPEDNSMPQPPPEYSPPDPVLPTSWPPNSANLWAICSTSQNGCTNHPLSQSMENVDINGHPVKATADSASSSSFIHPDKAKQLKLPLIPVDQDYEVGMASNSLKATSTVYCNVELRIKDRTYQNIKLFVLPNLCTSLILGLDFLSKHKSVILNYGGTEPPLSICGLSTLKTEPKSLFSNLAPDCKPIADSRRRYSLEDQAFIAQEITRMLKEDIIEPSKSPWRAQVVVVQKEDKKRLAVDYSQTINLYTQLDAYPLPLISDLINQIAQNGVYSTVDLASAYHQLLIKSEDRPYTAFEANGRLYQFKRLPFGVTNGVSIFQREMDQIIDDRSLKGVYPYLDNITICGKTQEEHDTNLANFLAAAEETNLKYNPNKCEFNTRKLRLLGYVIEKDQIRPDPERMRPLEELPPPHDQKSLKRCLGFFSYYSKWIPNFSEKIRPVAKVTQFPISREAIEAIEAMKADIRKAVMCSIDETIPFQVECDASEHALAATLNQNGKPVAFFSRALKPHELLYPSVEKEAMSIIEAIRYWRYLLAPRRFTLVTDQRSVSFMFDTNIKAKKIKNEKILRWRMELSTYNYDIHYRPGRLNESPDALSRPGRLNESPEAISRVCAASPGPSLQQYHEDLCHPGVTRLLHFVKTRNLPFSVEEVRAARRNCPDCLECKPLFHKPEKSHLIKATKPMERLNVDFKGPLPTTNKNAYFLNVVDEFSRFPWAFPCPNVDASTVSQCLTQLFTMCGFPNYIHSDRGSAFISAELKAFLSAKGIASSKTTPYNPQGNGQVEKENSTIWKAVVVTLKSKGLPISRWQEVLPQVLHATRSLLCTATNDTPHERFFSFPRRAAAGPSLPVWLLSPGPVFLKRHVRNRKTDPLVEPVELLEANPTYTHIQFPDGRESTVSIRDLAPALPSRDTQNTECRVTAEQPIVQPPAPVISARPAPMQPLMQSPVTPTQPVHQSRASPAPMQPLMQSPVTPSQHVLMQSPVTPSQPVRPPAKTVQPLMGRSGAGWCNVNQDNILPDTKRNRST